MTPHDRSEGVLVLHMSRCLLWVPLQLLAGQVLLGCPGVEGNYGEGEDLVLVARPQLQVVRTRQRALPVRVQRVRGAQLPPVAQHSSELSYYWGKDRQQGSCVISHRGRRSTRAETVLCFRIHVLCFCSSSSSSQSISNTLLM